MHTRQTLVVEYMCSVCVVRTGQSSVQTQATGLGPRGKFKLEAVCITRAPAQPISVND